MKFTKMEKYLIFAFGTEDRKHTVGRLGVVCSCTINGATRKQLVDLHNKLGELGSEWDGWFAEQFYLIQAEIENDVTSYNKVAWNLIELIGQQSAEVQPLTDCKGRALRVV